LYLLYLYLLYWELDPNISTAIYNTAFYGEYGVTDRWTTVVYAPLFSRNLYNNQVSSTTGDILISGESINSIGVLQTGDGEFNQSIQIDAGSGFQIGKTNAYFSTYVGVNNRTNGFSEEFRYGLEVGASFLHQKLWIIGRLGGIESFNNGSSIADVNSTSIFADRAEFTSFGAEASYYITRQFGVSASFATAFRGKIIAAAPSYSVGAFMDFSK